MRFSSFIAFLGAAASLAVASPAPLMDVEKTTVSLDNSAQSLNDGQIKVHLARVDDLIDDKDNNKLLLERNTHIAINIQMDADNKALNVNGQRVPLVNADEPHGAVAMSAIKAQSYTLAKDMPSDFYSPEHVQQLVSALSTGIVSLDVRLEVERVPVDTLGHHVSKDLVEAVAVPNLSLRKIGLFMRLTAVEGKKFKHTSNMYAPIVQLMVASNGPDGKIHTVNTLSVAGKPARGALAATPSRQKSAAKNTTIKQQLQEAAHRASREGPLSGLRDLWGSLMHQPKPKKPCADNKKKKPALSAGDRIKGLRKGKALAGHNPHRFPTAEESYRSQKQRKQDHAGLVKSACRRFTQTFFSTWSDGVVFVAVLMLLWAALFYNVRKLVQSRRNHTYEAVQQKEAAEAYGSEQDKHHLAFTFVDEELPPSYRAEYDENGVARSLYEPDMINSPAEILYDAAQEEEAAGEKEQSREDRADRS